MSAAFAAVFVGGGVGSCARFALTRAASMLNWSFPLGTLLSNVIAGFFIGFIITREQHVGGINANVRLFLTSGLMGGLSTFSTFSLETVTFFQSGKHALAVCNIVLNLVCSLLAVLAGMYAAEMLFAKT